jgi:hypothetical protein
MKRIRSERGTTLIEGMIATFVILFGLVGVVQGLIVASRQNSLANRTTRGAAIAHTMKTALEERRFENLFADDGILMANCSGGLEDYLGDLPAGATCTVDLDTIEAAAVEAEKLVPGYPPEDTELFRRVVAVYTDINEPALRYIGVVVSWNGVVGRSHYQVFAGMYDASLDGNESEVEF